MRAAKWFGLALALGVGIGFAACSGGETKETHPTTTGPTTSSGGAGGNTSTSSIGGGGSAPLTCDSAYTNITEGECDLLQQNCPPGQICAVTTIGGAKTHCRSSPGGLKDKGTVCTKDSECRDGLFCIADRCTPFCCQATDEPCGGGSCDIHVDFGGGSFAFVCSYPLSCTLFTGECPAGEQCHVSNGEQGMAVCDTPSGTPAPEGGPCQYRNDCGESQQCSTAGPEDPDAGTQSRCRYNCLVDSWQTLEPGLGGCPANQTCTDLAYDQMPNVGICVPS